MSDILPPPPPARSGSNPWKWAFIGCGGGCALIVVAFIVITVVIAKSPQFQQAIKQVTEVPMQAKSSLASLNDIHAGLQAYVKKHKKYPKKLEELVPDQLPASKLTPPSLAVPPEFIYKQPGKDAAGDFAVVELTFPAPIPVPGATPWTLKLRKDGKIDGKDWEYSDGRQRIRVNAETGAMDKGQ
jgi:hypothetical protein